MSNGLSVSTLLSHALVAFTVEFDNEFEHRMPHRTTNYSSKFESLNSPWLVSLAMYENCMRHVSEEGVTVRELERLARTPTTLVPMQRWGYIVVKPDPADNRPKLPSRDWLIRAKPAGRRAQQIWQPLFGEIEKRWRERFGSNEVDELRNALIALISQFDVELPDCMPILGYALVSNGPENDSQSPSNPETLAQLPLSALLSKALLAFAIEFERDSNLSLAMCANFLRVLDEKGVRTRDIPRLSGAATELSKNSLGFLAKVGYIAMKPDPTAKNSKIAHLTARGKHAQEAYRQRVVMIEDGWQQRFGKDAIRKLRDSLERLVGEPTAQKSPLFQGLEPYPDGWRAKVPKPETLPHFPLVTHRGGYPDGS